MSGAENVCLYWEGHECEVCPLAPDQECGECPYYNNTQTDCEECIKYGDTCPGDRR